jgi:hypothetical protein
MELLDRQRQVEERRELAEAMEARAEQLVHLVPMEVRLAVAVAVPAEALQPAAWERRARSS